MTYGKKYDSCGITKRAIGASLPANSHALTHFKKTALSESGRDAIRAINQEKLKHAYDKFYATKRGRKFAKTYGKSYSASSPHFTNGNSDVEFHDPADLPQSSVFDHPMEHMEPEKESGFSDRGIDPEELILIRDTFRQVFRWNLDGDGLVARGRRCNICIFRMKKDLSGGLTIDALLLKQFDHFFGNSEPLELTGYHFNRVLAWLRCEPPISQRGHRVDLLAYTLWPSLLDASTLATLGLMNNKTRQAMDKLANCLRDTFSGLKALAMRNDITRARCKYSQLQNHL